MTALTLSIGAICSFLLEFRFFQKERGAVLDMLDGELDMQRILAIKESLTKELPHQNKSPLAETQTKKIDNSFGIAVTE